MSVPAVTISVRRSFCHTNGVAQLLLLVAVGAPQFLAGPLVVGGDVRLLVVVVDEDDAILVEDRRRGGAESGARLHRRHLLRPDRLAVHVEREQADVAEVRIDALAVGDRRFGGVAVLLMA